jgi:hypothetical protein
LAISLSTYCPLDSASRCRWSRALEELWSLSLLSLSPVASEFVRCVLLSTMCGPPALARSPFTAARYHSLVIDKASFPEAELEITAWTDDGMVMGVQHRRYPHIQVGPLTPPPTGYQGSDHHPFGVDPSDHVAGLVRIASRLSYGALG